MNALYKHFFRIAAFLFLGAAVTGGILSFTGPVITDALLPSAWRIVSFLRPDYDIRELEVAYNEQPKKVTFTAIKDTPGGGVVFINSIKGIPITGYFTVNTFYTLPMIAFALLFAWPYLTLSRKLTVIPLIVPILLIFWLFDISLCVIGSIEYKARAIIDVAGDLTLMRRLETFSFSFLTTGGRQFLGILVFLLAIAPFHLIRKKKRDNIIAPNDPCPCGSGRKYKKCCGRQP